MGKYTMSQLRDRALDGGAYIESDIHRSFSHQALYEDTPGGRDLRAIRGLGYAMHASMWLNATSEKGMQYGTASRELRLENAAKFANKAGVPLYTIAETFGLEALLPPEEKVRLDRAQIYDAPENMNPVPKIPHSIEAE
jgi:hypothetical protein